MTDKLRQYVVKDYMSPPVIVKEDMTVYDAICTIFLEDAALYSLQMSIMIL